MKKTCNRCSQPFICREDRVDVCQCRKVHLTSQMREFVKVNYQDCLCSDCLQVVKNNFDACSVNPIYTNGASKMKAE